MGKPKNADYASMSDDEKAAYLHDARRRGGLTRCQQESMQDARSKGFWATMESHPFYARKHLRRRIKAQNRVRAVHTLIPDRPMKRRKPM